MEELYWFKYNGYMTLDAFYDALGFPVWYEKRPSVINFKNRIYGR